MKPLLIVSLFVFLCLPATGQTVSPSLPPPEEAIMNLELQRNVFPQEKIYMQTDKPHYLNGEKLFFRIFLLDAASNQAIGISRYVYVELINQVDTVLIRRQIRPETNLHYGAIELPEDLPQGYYRLRAYTRFMENLGEPFFYSRTIYVADSYATKMKLETEFEFLSDKQVGVNLRFVDAATGDVQMPKRITLQLNSAKKITVKPEANGWVHEKMNLDSNDLKRTLYVGYEGEKLAFNQFIKIPFPEEVPDVTFYPEGGCLIEEKVNKVAFKAMLPDGKPADVECELFNSAGELLSNFSSSHEGMGLFSLYPSAGQHLYVICRLRGQQDKSYRFELPEVVENAFSIQSAWRNNRLIISVIHSEQTPLQNLSLLVTNSGKTVCFMKWDFNKQTIQLSENDIPTGVSHLLLLTEDYRVISERLVFLNKNDQIKAAVSPSKNTYRPRELAKMDVQLNTVSSDTLSFNFSVSVTDDKDIAVDTTTNILAEILLASEVRGQVANPAWYFRQNDKAVEIAADLLMMTQGWNRYPVSDPMRGNFKVPSIENEISQSFSGLVKGGLFSKPYRQANVSLLSLSKGFMDITETNDEGRFRFDDFEFPDSTDYLIQALTRKGNDRVELYLDPVSYPAVTLSGSIPSTTPEAEASDWDDYISKANQKYVYENGMRIVQLQEVVIKGTRIEEKKEKNTYGVTADYSITEKDMEKFVVNDLLSLLRRLPGVIVTDRQVRIARTGEPPLFVIDGMRLNSFEELEGSVSPFDIAQVDLIKSWSGLAIYGTGAGNGVIEIITKKGKVNNPVVKFNTQSVSPLGFRTPIAFYSPKYDTPESILSEVPDLRSTIYWKPDVAADSSGKTYVDFYTADSPSTYSVVLEGVSSDGKLLYFRGKSMFSVKP